MAGPAGQHEEMPDLVVPEHAGQGVWLLAAVDDGAHAVEEAARTQPQGVGQPE
jgi:hypothetical protein